MSSFEDKFHLLYILVFHLFQAKYTIVWTTKTVTSTKSVTRKLSLWESGTVRWMLPAMLLLLGSMCASIHPSTGAVLVVILVVYLLILLISAYDKL